MRRKAFAISAMLAGWSALALVLLAGQAVSQSRASRDQAEQAIRASIFETMKAFLTGDVKTLKQRSAKRTFDLINLVYEAARQDPRMQEDLRRARITNADEFLRFFITGMASQYLQAAPMPPEQAARSLLKDAVVSFTSDSEARILVRDSGFARARLVGREWKIDLADSLKNAVLNEVKDPEMRVRIKSL